MTTDLSQKPRVGVLMGGLSAERDVSLQTGSAVLKALLSRGHDAVAVDVGRDPCGQLRAAGVEVAFVALHGTWGEDGCMQGLLECLHMPYTGSGVQASAVAMDKVLTKKLFAAAGIPTPAWACPADHASVIELGLPAVIKPLRDGSSVGLTIVREEAGIDDALAAARDPMAEVYIPGHELSVGVLGHGDDARVLGSVEIRPQGGHYDYEAKYLSDDTEYLAPAPVPGPVLEAMEAAALAAHRLIGCHGGTRTDFRWDGKSEPKALEINTIPGMTSHSLLPMVARLRGLDYADLCEALLAGACLKTLPAARGATP